MDAFEIVQWTLRGLLAFVFVGTGIVALLPSFRTRLAKATPSTASTVLTRGTTIIAAGVLFIALGAVLLTPWWTVRFIAALLLIALIVAVNLATIAAIKRLPNTGRLLAQLGLIALTLFAVI